jgi:hypothetical protein
MPDTLIPVQWYCGRDGTIEPGHAEIVNYMVWWRCGACDLHIDITDDFLNAMRDAVKKRASSFQWPG